MHGPSRVVVGGGETVMQLSSGWDVAVKSSTAAPIMIIILLREQTCARRLFISLCSFYCAIFIYIETWKARVEPERMNASKT